MLAIIFKLAWVDLNGSTRAQDSLGYNSRTRSLVALAVFGPSDGASESCVRGKCGDSVVKWAKPRWAYPELLMTSGFWSLQETQKGNPSNWSPWKSQEFIELSLYTSAWSGQELIKKTSQRWYQADHLLQVKKTQTTPLQSDGKDLHATRIPGSDAEIRGILGCLDPSPCRVRHGDLKLTKWVLCLGRMKPRKEIRELGMVGL